MTSKTRRTVRLLMGIPEGQVATCDPWRKNEPERTIPKTIVIGANCTFFSTDDSITWGRA